jgi:hypothetical protein
LSATLSAMKTVTLSAPSAARIMVSRHTVVPGVASDDVPQNTMLGLQGRRPLSTRLSLRLVPR